MTTSRPTVAVVIPCFGRGEFLGEAIESALEQTRRPDEIVVVDDGSPDGLRSVVEPYEVEGVGYLRQPNGGPGAARNTGVSGCRSEFVVFLDADDRLDPRYQERTLAFLQEAPPAVGYAYTQCRYFGAAEGTSHFPPFSAKRLLRDNIVHVSALLRTELVRRFPFDESLRDGLEDWDLYLTLAEHGIGGVLCDEPLLWYRKHGNGSRNDELEASGRSGEDLAHRIQRRHWRVGGPLLAARVELWYLRRHASSALAQARRGQR